jgi:hypothetical protein
MIKSGGSAPSLAPPERRRGPWSSHCVDEVRMMDQWLLAPASGGVTGGGGVRSGRSAGSWERGGLALRA